MTLESNQDISYEDLKAGMENLISFLGDDAFSKHEMAALKNGFPPPEGCQAVITPTNWQTHVNNNPSESLVPKAENILNEFCGHTPRLNFAEAFESSSSDPSKVSGLVNQGLENQNTRQLDNPFILKPPAPSGGGSDSGNNGDTGALV